eukprot:8493334-Pyramimonas_sp.AAC.1
MEEKGWWWDFSLDTHSLQNCRERGGLQALKNISESFGKGTRKALWILFGHAGFKYSITVLAN